MTHEGNTLIKLELILIDQKSRYYKFLQSHLQYVSLLDLLVYNKLVRTNPCSSLFSYLLVDFKVNTSNRIEN